MGGPTIRSRAFPCQNASQIGMGYEIIPGRDPAPEVVRVDTGKRAELKIPVVCVVASENEAGLALRPLHPSRIFEPVGQTEGAVMEEIVAHPHISRRRLGRHGFQGRMRFEGGHNRGPAVIGNAEDADPAVVPGNVFDQPVDRVIGVGRLIRGPRVGAVGPQGRIMMNWPSDLAGRGCPGRRRYSRRGRARYNPIDRGGVSTARVVGGPVHQKGQGAGGRLGRPDSGVELDSVRASGSSPRSG